MRVLLIKDVHKLGRAGDIKRVADGYGRNYLIPQGLAILATQGALKQIDHIRSVANDRRAQMNQEMEWLANKLNGVTLKFQSKAGETGKLYGSITTQMISDALSAKVGTEIDRRMIDTQPIRMLGEHKAIVRLTVDLTPEISIFIYREGEAPKDIEKEITKTEEKPIAESIPTDESSNLETSESEMPEAEGNETDIV